MIGRIDGSIDSLFLFASIGRVDWEGRFLIDFFADFFGNFFTDSSLILR